MHGNAINPRYLVWVLDKAGREVGFSRTFRASIDRIKGLNIKVPAIDIQQTIVAAIEKLEQQINTAQVVINEAAAKKTGDFKKVFVITVF